MGNDPGKVRLPLLAVKAPDFENLNARLRLGLISMSDSLPDQVSNQAEKQSYFENKWLSGQDLHKSKDHDMQEQAVLGMAA